MEHDVVDHERLTALLAAAPLTNEEPVVSLYLSAPNTAGERKLILKNLVKQGEEAIHRDTGFDDERKKSAAAALKRAHQAAEDALGRGHTRPGTFVAFAWKDRTETFRVPVVLRDRIIVDRSAYTSPLTTVLQEHEHWGVVLVDHKIGRIFDYFLGVLSPLEDVKDKAEPKTTSGVFKGLEQTRREHHHEYVLHNHLQHVADRVFAHHKRRAFDRIVLAGLPETVTKLERCLHTYLKGKVAAREHWAHDLPKDEVKKRTAELERRVELEKEKKLLALVRDHVCGDLLATTGFDETLRALYYGKVATLIVEDGVPRCGRECPECRFLFLRPEDAKEKTPTLVPCSLCNRPTRSVPDVVDEAVELAILSGARVEHIVHAKDDIAGLGHMASILRFR